MPIRNWKKEICTIPNLLSLFRLFLIPVYVAIYQNASTPRDHLIAGAILAFSCFTDAVDGFIARRFHMVSTLGKLLDPLADKVTQITLSICLSLRYPILFPVIILLLIKEAFQVVGAFILMRRGEPLPSALMAGKISTAVLFTTFTALVIFPKIGSHIVALIAMLDCICLIYAFITYYATFFRKTK